ncbi:PPE family protein [Mycobacterium talmoniae]|uniref:Putative PPE family protein PPE29 n=1 Tax=Mycobacterium talmoniae TaxID=1858794 RepID=A0A1S1MX16_9MYCO|nr:MULTISPECIES: PPE family protein [Mycobacterium]OHU93330.1 hypothetical protein BKN37_24125 [Mycobacterium talmoniae]PQM48648.1 putative PPE family protein PPE29 [Mycobacterium talmoniae]
MLDFGVLPPEVNSAAMYDGAGPGSLIASASAWTTLAAELHSTVAGYQAAKVELAGSWRGRSSTLMDAAFARYLAWLSHTAGQAQQTAEQMSAAIAAYEAAVAAIVPPPAIQSNRAALTTLTATNALGQNTPAITAVEADYAEMWAQDAAAMYRYAASVAAASELPVFGSPPPVSHPAQQSGHGPALAHAAGSSTTGHVQLMSAITQQLHALASGGATKSGAAETVPGLLQGVKDFNTVTGPLQPAWQVAYAANRCVNFLYAMKSDLEAHSAAAQTNPVPQLASAPTGTTVPGRGPVLASMGCAPAVGGLSVPPNWAPATPMAGTAADLPSAGMRVRALPLWAQDPLANSSGGSPMWGPGPPRGSPVQPLSKKVLRMRTNRFTMPRPSVGG